MSITDELREWGRATLADTSLLVRMEAIADRIDAEHKRVEQDLIDANNQMEQLCECSVELPKDADNVPWNVCDCDEDGNEVTELRLTPSGWFVLTDDEWPYRPERHRHYHAPTVEEVLREFGIDWEHESDCEDRAALLKEYASKLKLAEEDA